MASNTLDDLIPSATAAHSRSLDHAGTQTVFVNLVNTAITGAVTSGLFTVTVAEGSTSSTDIQWVIEELRHNGYTVTTSTTNVVISW